MTDLWNRIPSGKVRDLVARRSAAKDDTMSLQCVMCIWNLGNR